MGNEEVEKDESEAINESKSEIADPEEIESSHKKSKKKKKKSKEAKEEPSEIVEEEAACLKIKSEPSTKFVESGSITDYFAMKMKAKKEREAQQNEGKLETNVEAQEDSTEIGSSHKKSKKKKK